MRPSLSRIDWRKTARLVPSRFPPISLFDRVADSTAFEALCALESMTNDRLRDEAGDIRLVPPEERIFGPGTTPIMAAFTHPNPQGSRFGNGSYGVYYAAKSIDTAIAEVGFHLGRFYLATREAATQTDMRTYFADIDAELHDIRGKQSTMPDIYDAESYAASQPFAFELRDSGSTGIVYNSVRHTAGECIAVFRPNALKPAIQGPHFRFNWNGTTFNHVVQYHTTQ